MVTQLGCVSETAIDSKAGSGSTIPSLRERLFKVFDITAVASDMSKSYLPGVKENFPKAEQIIDKFHVKKVLTDAFAAMIYLIAGKLELAVPAPF